MKWIFVALIAALCGFGAFLFLLHPSTVTAPAYSREFSSPTKTATWFNTQRVVAPRLFLDERNSLPFSRATINALFEMGLSLDQVKGLVENPPPFPIENLFSLLNAGLPFEEIQEMEEVYRGWFEEDAHAFVRLSVRIPDYDAYQMARYASIITGGGIDPLLMVAILRTETVRGKGIGTCRYFLDEKRRNPNLLSLPGEAEAFKQIVAGINSTRDPRYRMKKSYPVVSCHYDGGYGGAMSIFQVLPSMYLKYEREVARAMGVEEFVSPYHFIPAFLAAAAILRDIARQYRLEPRLVMIGEEEVVRKIAASYYAGRNWKFHVGDERYGGRVYALAVEHKLEREEQEQEKKGT